MMAPRQVQKPQPPVRISSSSPSSTSKPLSPPPKSPALAMFVSNSGSSRIPVRTANAEKRAEGRSINISTSLMEDSPVQVRVQERVLSPLEIAALKAEKRASWRQARLKSLEQDALKAQEMIQNMNQMAEDFIEDAKNENDEQKVVFPRIAIKSSPGAVIVREREKIVDEKIVQRTEEVSCPITGQPKLRTVEYVEKVIETEVETCQEKIISLELHDPEKEVPILPGSDDDSSSIITIRPNPDKLFLRHDDDDDYNGDEDYAGKDITDKSARRNDVPVMNKIALNSFGSGGQKKMEGHVQSFSMSSSSSEASARPVAGGETVVSRQTIVEVVNPVIAGDGSPNKIVIGRSKHCPYPSFDDYSTYSEPAAYTYAIKPDDGQGGDDEDDDMERIGQHSMSTISYSHGKHELSLNAKMKNVLEELLENERVKLNLSRSLIEDDSSDPDEDDEEEDEDEELDDDDDEEEKNQKQAIATAVFASPEKHDNNENDTDDIQFRHQIKSNGNVLADNIRMDSNENFKATMQTRENIVADIVDDERFDPDEYHGSFVDGCRVYINPNTAMSFNDIKSRTTATTAGTTTTNTMTTIVKDFSMPVATQENRTLVEKLMSQLHADDDKDINIMEDIKSSDRAIPQSSVASNQKRMVKASNERVKIDESGDEDTDGNGDGNDDDCVGVTDTASRPHEPDNEIVRNDERDDDDERNLTKTIITTETRHTQDVGDDDATRTTITTVVTTTTCSATDGDEEVVKQTTSNQSTTKKKKRKPKNKKK